MNDDLLRSCAEAWTAEGLSDKTIHAYALVLARADRMLAELGSDVLTASPSQIRRIADAWPLTRSSRMQLRVALARAWEVAGRHETAPLAVRVPRKPTYRCRALPEPQAALLARTAAEDGSPAGLAVMLGLYLGYRNAEIARAAWSDFDLVTGWARLVGKGDLPAELPIHRVLAARLASTPRAGRWLFPGGRGREHVTRATVWNWVRDLSRRAIGREISPHVLRHTAIATLNDLTGDLRVAQAFARHASPETTVLYTRVSARRLERAVGLLDYETAAQGAES